MKVFYVIGEIFKWILISPLLAFGIAAIALGIALFCYFILPLILCVWFLWIWIPGWALIWFLTKKLPELIENRRNYINAELYNQKHGLK